MAISRTLRDRVYLLIVGTQLFGMLGSPTLLSSYYPANTRTAMDLVPFYPKALYESSSAPLHFLVTLRSTYVSLTHDPFFVESAHEPWFQAFMYIEALVQFPLAVYLVCTLINKGAATELAGLAFGCVTGMGSVTCCYVLATTTEEVLSSEKRAMLFWGEYLPFAVIREFQCLSESEPC